MPEIPPSTDATKAATRNKSSAAAQIRTPQYDFVSFEQKWRQRWEEQKLYQVDVQKAPKPYYNLMMFPYPSAEGLHVGNFYSI